MDTFVLVLFILSMIFFISLPTICICFCYKDSVMKYVNRLHIHSITNTDDKLSLLTSQPKYKNNEINNDIP